MSKKSTRSALFSYARWFSKGDNLLQLTRSYSNIFGEDLQVYTTGESSSGFRYLSDRHVQYTSCGNSKSGRMTRKHTYLAVVETRYKKKEAGYDIEGKEESIEFSFADQSFIL